MIKIGEDNKRLRQDGAILTDKGLLGFPDNGIWTADDRILTFCNQESGGITNLIFHGSQPQSANSFLLQDSKGALMMGFVLESLKESTHNIQHRFEHVAIKPYGWKNTFKEPGLKIKTQFCAQNKHLVWAIKCKNQSENPIKFAPYIYLNTQALVSDVNGSRVWQDPCVKEGAIVLRAHDQLQTRTWIDVPGMKDKFIDSETVLLIAGEDTNAVVDGLSLKLDAEEIPPGDWGRCRYFLVVCDRSESQGFTQLSQCRANKANIFKAQYRRYTEVIRSSPQLNIPGYCIAEATYKLVPLYTEATKVGNTGALRSSSGGYYFVWGWDSQMGGHELTRWGDRNAAKKLIQFIDNAHDTDGPVPHRYDNDLQPYHVTGFDFVSQLYISLLYHVFCDTLDLDFLRIQFPFAKNIFETLYDRTDERGFYRTLGMYPDAPIKLGRSSESLVSYEVGFWYCTCRMIEILAGYLGESEVARLAADIARRLEENYIQAFYDPASGFLVDALVEPGEQSNGTFPRYALFPYHNSFGAWLLRPERENLSQFIKQEFFKSDGIRMVPTWDPHINTETVTGNCWFLHFDLYCLKVFRRANDGAAIRKWLDLAESYITQRSVIPELQIMSPDGDNGARWAGITGQIWQLFAMSGWLRGLLEGVLGIEIDIGGLTYIPCDSSPNGRLVNFPFRDGRWEIQVTGTGPWLEYMTIDGRNILGVMKIPLDYFTPGSHFLRIHRTHHQPKTPILFEAVGAGIMEPRIEGKTLSLMVKAHNQVNILFFSPKQPKVYVDMLPIQVDWDLDSKIGSFNFPVNGMVRLRMKGA